MCTRVFDHPIHQLPRPNLFHILLVEPDLDHADLIRIAIQQENAPFFIHHVPDSQQALDFLTQRTPQLILLDLNLPQIRGQELLAKLKSDDNLLNIPTVVLTQDPAETPLPKKHRFQTNAYHPKPESFQQFQTLVHQVNQYWRHWQHEPLQNISAA